MTTIIKATFSDAPYAELSNLHDELEQIIYKHTGTVPLMGVLGVLELLKAELIVGHK